MKYVAIIFVCISSLTHAQFINNTGIVIANSSELVTNGDWQNSGTILNNGKITTSENWQNNGILDVASYGGFVFQNLSDKNFNAGSNSSKIGFLQVEASGQVIITGKLLVNDSLKILSGVIKMNSAADTLATASTLVYASNGSYVDGPMAHFGAGTFSLPVGSSGQSLPITFYSATSNRVGVVVEPLPAGYSAGEAVESITAFPYAWRSVKSLASDTASYVEVKVPDALVTGITNPVLAKKVPDLNQLEGMGSRLVSSDGNNTTVRSYSRGLKGLFSIANGFPGNMLGDSTQLVALYNSTNGVSWTNKTNWTTSAVSNWYGITEKGGRVTRVVLPNNNVSGTVPATITTMNALKIFNVASNSITTVPNFTTVPAITTLDVSGNNLDFGSLESNAGLIGVNYVNQAPVNPPLDIEIPVNTNYQLQIPVAGTSNVYTWKLNGNVIAGSTTDTHDIVGIKRATMGTYVLEITNPLVPGLVLTSSNQRILATADISGTLFVSTTAPATAGKMQLLKVTSTGSYDTTRIQNLNSNGTYLFDNVVLDDYIVNGYADTIVHKKAIPTYYENTIFWEEADTLFVEDNITGLDIYSEFKPDPPTAGQGEINGTLYIGDEPDGRTSKVRAQKATAVAVRRAEGSGKGLATVYRLIGYIFTDEEGEFDFTKLETGLYRLNIQYPGYPMDTNSYIDITIGSTLFDRQVGVEAEVTHGKIEVKKLVITGWEEEAHAFTAYPNPTADYLFVKGAGVGNSRPHLTDATGRKVIVPTDWNNQDVRWELNIRNLQRGVYFLQMNRNGKIETAQIHVQ
ncbi:MAG TPA: T9SS type A sorting domain-containing protein [Cyclobacteriaceae bacterium]|nr:T9SS type A sorting domain-containing protein [Cyclobacteriaceae bacterium]